MKKILEARPVTSSRLHIFVLPEIREKEEISHIFVSEISEKITITFSNCSTSTTIRILFVPSLEFCSWSSEAAIKSEEMSWEKRVRCVDTYVILWHCNTFIMEMVYSFERGEVLPNAGFFRKLSYILSSWLQKVDKYYETVQF